MLFHINVIIYFLCKCGFTKSPNPHYWNNTEPILLYLQLSHQIPRATFQANNLFLDVRIWSSQLCLHLAHWTWPLSLTNKLHTVGLHSIRNVCDPSMGGCDLLTKFAEMNTFGEDGHPPFKNTAESDFPTCDFIDEGINDILGIITTFLTFATQLRTSSSWSCLRSASFKKHCIHFSSACRRSTSSPYHARKLLAE